MPDYMQKELKIRNEIDTVMDQLEYALNQLDNPNLDIHTQTALENEVSYYIQSLFLSEERLERIRSEHQDDEELCWDDAQISMLLRINRELEALNDTLDAMEPGPCKITKREKSEQQPEGLEA